VFRWRATCHWKALDKGYNFAIDLISIGGLHAKIWASKVTGVPTLGISGLPLGSPKTKCHLDVGPMARHRVYYEGEGGGFPQVPAVVSLVSPNLPWLVLALKVLQLCTNQLVFWFCVVPCEWLKFLSTFLVPSWSSSTPLYPQSAASQRTCHNLPTIPMFSS
jgi:hypothetical protein